jgi:WD40 repeat protein
MAKIAHSVSSERLPRFLRQASRMLELLLGENAANAAGVRAAFAVSAKWTNSMRRFSSPSYLFNRSVLDVTFSPVVNSQFVATYGPVQGDGFLRDRGFVCVWQAQDTEKPAHVLTCDGQPTCACFAATSPFIVVAGTAEGGVVLWDLREPMSAHESIKVGQHTALLRRPTFCSDAQRRDNHLASIVRIMPNEANQDEEAPLQGDDGDLASTGSSKFASVDEQSFVSIWVAVQVSTAGERDPGLSPHGSVRLVRSAWFSPLASSPDADMTLVARTSDICFNPTDPSQYLLATDTGRVVRGARFAGDTLFPRFYGYYDWPPAASVATSPAAPGCFLAGYTDGALRLFSLESELPIAEWQGFIGAGHGVHRVLWSLTRPNIFFVIDTAGYMHIFDVNLR